MHVVAGATTVVGRQVVGELLRRRLEVRVIVRATAAAREFASMGADVAVADVTAPAAVEAACRGADAVISLVGRHFASTERGMWQVDAEGNETLIRAAAAAGAHHFVLLSVLFAERDVEPVVMRAKYHAERALGRSGLPSTVLRPSSFVVGPSSLVGIVGPTIERLGLAPVPGRDSRPVSWISESDVAAAIVRALERGPEGRVWELGGPEALTIGEGARRVGREVGRRVRLVRVPRRLLRALRFPAKRVGFGPYEALLFLDMLARDGYECDPAQARELLEREPRSVEETLRDHYRRQRRTPWSESIYGTLALRNR